MARNRIPDELKLYDHPRVEFLEYSTLVLHPKEVIHHLLRRIGLPGAWKDFNVEARTSNLDKPAEVNIARALLEEADGILGRLRKHALMF